MELAIGLKTTTIHTGFIEIVGCDGELSALLCAGWFLLFYRGNGTTGADFGER